MSDIATELISAYQAKTEMSAAFLEKGIDDIPSCISSYGNVIRNLGSFNVTMPDIEGNISKTVSIPYGTKAIGPYAFAYNPNLTTIKIPSTVVRCDPTAFTESSPALSISAPVIFKDIVLNQVSPSNISYSTVGQPDGTYVSTDSYGISWQYTVSNEMATITKLSTGFAENIKIPAFFGDTPVRSIGSQALADKPMLSVTIPNTVTSFVGQGTFARCSNLRNVAIPDSVKLLNNNMFLSCVNLAEISIPDSVSAIPYGCFANCDGLTSISMNKVSSFGLVAFLRAGINSIRMPTEFTGKEGEMTQGFAGSSLTAFYAEGCEELSAPELFVGCSSLRLMHLPKLKILGKIFGFDSSDATQRQLSNLTTLRLPSIEYIEAGTFGYSDSLRFTNITDLYIPNKAFREIVSMDNYSLWHLDPYCAIHALDRTFYYDLSLNNYTYTI